MLTMNNDTISEIMSVESAEKNITSTMILDPISIFDRMNIGTFAYKSLEHICGEECFEHYTDIEEFGNDPYEPWVPTTTFKPIQRFIKHFNMRKLYNKPKNSIYPINYTLYGPIWYHRLPTAIELNFTFEKEYFYTLYICIPHYKTKYLNKYYKSKFKEFLKFTDVVEKDKQGNIFCIFKLTENWFYPNIDYVHYYCSILQPYLHKTRSVIIKEHYSDLKLYAYGHYLGKITGFYKNNICNPPYSNKPYKTFLLTYGTLNKNIFVNSNLLSEKDLYLLETKFTDNEEI